MITTSHARRTDAAGSAAPPGLFREDPVPDRCPHGCAVARTVTAGQVDAAVTQLRERRGLSAVEQVQAVMRAFGLTVAPPVAVPDQR